MHCSLPGSSVLHCLPEFAQTHVHWVNHAIQPSHPLSIPSPYALSLFQHQGLFNELALHIRWPKYWSFSPSNEYSGLISFRIDWFDLLAVQRTLKSLLQHHSSKASVLRHSAFFIVQLSHSYMTTGKTVVLTIWTFVGKVLSLLFNTLSTFAFQGAGSRECFQKAQISIFFFFWKRGSKKWVIWEKFCKETWF